MRKLIALLLFVFFAVFSASAQSFRGSISGHLLDASGNTLSQGQVTARSVETGAVRSAVVDGRGGYTLRELSAGNYVVTAESASLRKVSRQVLVSVGLETSVDFELGSLEKVVQQVEVTAAAPLIEPTRDTLSQVVDNRLVQDFPLNGRDFGKLVALTPGVTVEGSGVAGTEKGFGQFNINGNRDRSNNYLLDGADDNDPFFNNSALNQVGITGAPASLLPIDAIQEFNLQTQAAAEYGRNSGATVNILTKSGTNQFHGALFEYVRNSAFDARNYFNTVTNSDGTANPQSPFKNNQFGGSIGGPIQQNRTFFFAAYEAQRERVTSDFDLYVPTAKEISAARAIAVTQLGTSVNPALDKILAYFPTSTTGTVNGAVNDLNDLSSVIGKIDHQFSPHESAYVNYVYSSSNQRFPLGGLGYGTGSRIGSFAQVSPTRVQVASGGLLTTIGNSTLNEFRVGYSRYHSSFAGADANLDPTSMGLDLGDQRNGLPEIDFGGLVENLGASAYSIPRARTSQTVQLLDNLSFVRGKHSIKVGAEYRRAIVNSYDDNLERGLLDVNDETDANGNNLYATDSVTNMLVSYYTGDIDASIESGNTQRTTVNNNFGVFAQDDYRLTDRLTINGGLRWEYFGPLSETHGLISNYDFNTKALLQGRGYDPKYTSFSPRLGFALRTLPNTVVRGGYGLYYDYIPQNLLIANYANAAGLTTNPIGAKPVVSMNFDGSAWASNIGPAYVASGGPYSIFGTGKNFTVPYTQSWNLNVQQQLGQAASFELGYVGSKGTHLTRLYDANQTDAYGNYPNANYEQIGILSTESASNYHALQATVRSRDLHGISGFTSYTWSHSIDDASDGIDYAAGIALPQDSTNLRAEHGNSSFDTRQRFTLAFNYLAPRIAAVPVWAGKGWQANAIATVQSGRPIQIANSDDTSERYNYRQRPNLVPGVNPILSHWTPAGGYLNPAAFTQPADGTFGDLGRNQLYGPGFWNTDVSLLKSTPLRRNLELQLRAEFFNIFNHPNFALPDGSLSFGDDANGNVLPMGVISQTPDVAQGNPGLGGGGPRVMQFSARIQF
ncbi:TonB-dependent receptor domain-containing protein [Telmatobacter bradus]|uniref:TonB-dependent receptor n=1 Tax=Telmatobacter bradus TaxID=474953 RepID=UPI003B43B504